MEISGKSEKYGKTKYPINTNFGEFDTSDKCKFTITGSKLS